MTIHGKAFTRDRITWIVPGHIFMGKPPPGEAVADQPVSRCRRQPARSSQPIYQILFTLKSMPPTNDERVKLEPWPPTANATPWD